VVGDVVGGAVGFVAGDAVGDVVGDAVGLVVGDVVGDGAAAMLSWYAPLLELQPSTMIP
jgi:hypothetical protein